jgi:hypothetical protein
MAVAATVARLAATVRTYEPEAAIRGQNFMVPWSLIASLLIRLRVEVVGVIRDILAHVDQLLKVLVHHLVECFRAQ